MLSPFLTKFSSRCLRTLYYQYYKKMVWIQEITLIENDHLADWEWLLLATDVCQPVQKPSSESLDSEDDFCTGCQNLSHWQQSFSGLGSHDAHLQSRYSQYNCPSPAFNNLTLVKFYKISFDVLRENKIISLALHTCMKINNSDCCPCNQ